MMYADEIYINVTQWAKCQRRKQLGLLLLLIPVSSSYNWCFQNAKSVKCDVILSKDLNKISFNFPRVKLVSTREIYSSQFNT